MTEESSPSTDSQSAESWPYFLGLPFWGHKTWAGDFYRPKVKAADHLRQYAQVFNTVEGNTTFYSLPGPETVERWQDSVPDTFRFSFKLPRWISHELQLQNAEEQSLEFFERLAPLGKRLGPFLIQLPPSFGPQKLRILDRYLGRLPQFRDCLQLDASFAVEVRHLDLCDPSAHSKHLDEILRHHGVERCFMDTRALRSGDPTLPEVIEASRKKPDLPMPVPALECALGPHPIIRFVGHPDAETTKPWIERWTRVLAQWIQQGRHPYFMVHLPDNTLVPDLAAQTHASLGRRTSLPDLPIFPARRPEPEVGGRQLSLLL